MLRGRAFEGIVDGCFKLPGKQKCDVKILWLPKFSGPFRDLFSL